MALFFFGGDADVIVALNTKDHQHVKSGASEEEQCHDIIIADSREEQRQDVISATEPLDFLGGDATTISELRRRR